MEESKSYQEILNELNTIRNQHQELSAELNEVRFRLEEANDIIEAIKMGEVDALVVKNGDGHQLYTLKNADQTYRIFIEQMTEGAITLNPNGNILYSNSQFAMLMGLPLEKVTGLSISKFIAPADLNFCKQLIKRAWKNNIKGEVNLLAGDGTQIPVLLSLKTLDLDEGLSLSVILTDLSGQKETQRLLQKKNAQLEDAQRIARNLNVNLENTVKERTRELETTIFDKTKLAEELRSNQEQLSRILETMAEGVGIIDIAGNLTYANPMAQKMMGLHEDGNLERIYYNPKWQNLKLDGTPLSEEEHPMYVSMATGQPVYDYEIGIQPPDQEQFYISMNAAPIYDDKGAVIGSIGTFMDVTNRRKIIQVKDDFISVASHELKTPITSLKASLQLLNRIKDKPNEIYPRLIEQANKSMHKVSSLLEDLLNASRVTVGQLHMNKSQFKLASIVEESCHHLHSAGEFKVMLEGETELDVYADPIRIEQVVVNFLNNAVKYAPGSKEIRVLIQKMDRCVQLSVIDNGPGIASDKLPHLFDRYYRVDDSGVQYSGLGLGLYICAEIIKKHDGEIGAESVLGKGSSFWFSLPLS